MAVGAMTYFYRRLGARYPLAFMAVELQTALFIVAGTLALFTFYFEGRTDEYLTVLVIALVLTEIAIVASLCADQAARSARSATGSPATATSGRPRRRGRRRSTCRCCCSSATCRSRC